MEDIFEKAAELKVRFDTTKGQLATEDLYDYPVDTLDSMAQAVNKQLRQESEESFIPSKAKKRTTTLLELKLEILKAVIKHKLAKEEARKLRSERRAELDMLQGLLQDKKVEGMKAMSLEDIQKKIAELQPES